VNPFDDHPFRLWVLRKIPAYPRGPSVLAVAAWRGLYRDLFQEVELAVHKAKQTWHPGKSTVLWARWAISRGARKFLQLYWGCLKDVPTEEVCIPVEQELPGWPAFLLRSGLSERDKYVLVRRYGLDGEGGRTVREIGRELGISGQRVNQIERAAIRRLRREAER